MSESKRESDDFFLVRMETHYAFQFTGEIDQKLPDEDFARLLDLARIGAERGKVTEALAKATNIAADQLDNDADELQASGLWYDHPSVVRPRSRAGELRVALDTALQAQGAR